MLRSFVVLCLFVGLCALLRLFVCFLGFFSHGRVGLRLRVFVCRRAPLLLLLFSLFVYSCVFVRLLLFWCVCVFLVCVCLLRANAFFFAFFFRVSVFACVFVGLRAFLCYYFFLPLCTFVFCMSVILFFVWWIC